MTPLANVAESFGNAIADTLKSAAVEIVNLVIAGAADAAKAIIAILPPMPAMPDLSGATWLGWLSFFMPVGGMLAALSAFIVCWTGFLAVRLIGKWVKAL